MSILERTVTLSRTATGVAVPTAAQRALTKVRENDPVTGWVGALGVTFLALFLRLWNLSQPRAFLFDETYYAKDAWSLLHFGYAQNYVDKANEKILSDATTGQWNGSPEMVVHPEVGKWLIGLGESIFGMNPLGWRVASAVVGALMVLVMIRLARRVTGSTLLGLTAGLLMCCDGLQLVLSRLALLDIFVAFFTLCAVSCHVADRDWGRRKLARLVPGRLPSNAWGPVMLWRPWRLAAGVMWGLALGTKWSALFVLAGFCLLTWAWDSGARRSFGVGWAWLKSAYLDALPAVGYLLLVPFVVYLATWTGWLMHHEVYEQALSNTQYGPYWGSYVKADHHGLGEVLTAFRSLWNYHQDVYSFHTHFLNDATHIYQSKPQGWLLLNRPVGVDAQLNIQPGAQGCDAATGSTCLRQVLLLGTPALWWIGCVALVWSVIAWIGKRDWRYGVVVVGVATTWLPWLRYDDRPIFSYYAISILPFLVLGLVLLLGELIGPRAASPRWRQIGTVIAGAVVVLVLVNFAWFWPIYTDGLITNAQWQQRIWFKRWI